MHVFCFIGFSLQTLLSVQLGHLRYKLKLTSRGKALVGLHRFGCTIGWVNGISFAGSTSLADAVVKPGAEAARSWSGSQAVTRPPLAPTRLRKLEQRTGPRQFLWLRDGGHRMRVAERGRDAGRWAKSQSREPERPLSPQVLRQSIVKAVSP